MDKKEMQLRVFEIVTKPEYLPQETFEEIAYEWDLEYALIKHDSDVISTGELVDEHEHIVCRANRPLKVSTIANKFGIEENFINKCKHGFGAALAYLTHANAPEKYQYEDEKVTSNFGWIVERDAYLERQERSKAGNRYIKMIVSGMIKPYQKGEIPYDVYINNYKNIDKAFEYYQIKNSSPDRNMKVMYVTGATGSGKTVYAKKWAKDHDLKPFISSGSNDIFYGMKYEPCVVLDDLRPNMDIDQFIKMTDNHTNSTVSARYRNADLSNCKQMIITSILPLDVFIKRLAGGDKFEDLNQVMRRINEVVEIIDGRAIHQKWDGNKLVVCEIEDYSPEEYFGGDYNQS